MNTPNSFSTLKGKSKEKQTAQGALSEEEKVFFSPIFFGQLMSFLYQSRKQTFKRLLFGTC